MKYLGWPNGEVDAVEAHGFLSAYTSTHPHFCITKRQATDNKPNLPDKPANTAVATWLLLVTTGKR